MVEATALGFLFSGASLLLLGREVAGRPPDAAGAGRVARR